MTDILTVKNIPYTPRPIPKEGLIPAHVNYLKSVSVWDAAKLGYKVRPTQANDFGSDYSYQAPAPLVEEKRAYVRSFIHSLVSI